MSKRGYISRYLMLINRLTGKPFSTFEDLANDVTQQLATLHMQDDTLIMGFSKRTLQRDIREIRTLFGINIIYDSSRKGYSIDSTECESSSFQRMMEAFDLFNSLNMTRDLSHLVSAEPRRPAGTENAYSLLHAIKNNLQIKFIYSKFWNDERQLRTVEPYLLKEFRNRWYVITIPTGDNIVRTFALDRISDLEITTTKFKKNRKVNMEDVFQYSFGIMSGDGQPPQKVVLSFDPVQGKYIKSLPLHSSQQILIDNEEELRISLELYLTFDLFMEIRSFGEDVKVIEPISLKKQIIDSLQSAVNQYA
ncbi:MAG: helix-turn-helix transcriptional regulator [Sphingobacteriaceae bacterium]